MEIVGIIVGLIVLARIVWIVTEYPPGTGF